MPRTILVSQRTFEQLKLSSSAKAIADEHRIKDVVIVDDASYCITAVQSSFVIGYRVVMLTHYTGTTEPLTYKNHQAAVRAGNRPRSCDGLMLKYHGAFAVLTGEYVRFELNYKKLEQLTMF